MDPPVGNSNFTKTDAKKIQKAFCCLLFFTIATVRFPSKQRGFQKHARKKRKLILELDLCMIKYLIYFQVKFKKQAIHNLIGEKYKIIFTVNTVVFRAVSQS